MLEFPRTAALLCLLPFASANADKPLEELLPVCESCHGVDGYSENPEVPIIAGFSYNGFIDTLNAFREDERIAIKLLDDKGHEKAMNDIARTMTDKEVESLAAFYSVKPFRAPEQEYDTALAKKGAELHEKHCEKCHSAGGSDPQDDAAILAGQWKPYMERQFKNMETGLRIVPKRMKRKVDKLSAGDKQALVHFYASNRAEIK